MFSNESSNCFAEDNDSNSYPFSSENFISEPFGSSSYNNNQISESKEEQGKLYFFLFKLINLFIFILI